MSSTRLRNPSLNLGRWRIWACVLTTSFAFPVQAKSPPGKPPAHKASVPSAQPLQTLSPEARATLDAIAEDPAATVNSTHYVTSNENRHEKFRAHLVGRQGGAYVGIGADQNYLLMGWTRPEVAVLTDFDSHVVNVHAVYQAFFAAAKTPFRFRLLWQKGYRAEGRRAIAAFYAGAERLAERKRALDTFDHTRKRVAARISWLRKHLRTHRVPSVYTHQADYDHVRNMALTGRIVARITDMTGKKAMKSVGDSLRKLGVSVSTLFLSNAEYYFPYGAQFRANVSGLPWAKDAVVLRTRSLGRGVYEYYVQSARHMVAFAQDPGAADVFDVLARRRATDTKLLFEIPTGPEGPRDPKVKRRKGAAAVKTGTER